MTCGGSHLGFPIGIKNRGPSNDHSWAVWLHRLTLDPIGKCSNAFFSETTNIIKAKLYMNVHWMVLYKLYVFCSGMKFKMAANIFPIGSKVKLIPTVAAILNFISEQKTLRL
jgi:hypothetical protein